MDASAEISADLEELRSFESQASRPNVRTFLNREIERLEKACGSSSVLNGSGDQSVEIPPSKSVPTAPLLPFNKIHTYAWDQSEKFLKIYVTLSGAQNANPQQVDTTFSQRGVKLSVHNLNGKNHELEINNLLHEIVPDKSYHKLKTDMVLVMLKKQSESTNWEHVTMQEKRAKDKKTPKFDDDKGDPQAGLMKMMKQMYDEGDDDMKRTIKKAWVESQEKKMKGEESPMDL